MNGDSEVLAGGSVALGESYMDGWWDCDALDLLFVVMCRDLSIQAQPTLADSVFQKRPRRWI